MMLSLMFSSFLVFEINFSFRFSLPILFLGVGGGFGISGRPKK